MKMNYLISVIVPVYKAEKYLNQCIESIVSQTYQNLQIILVDDGSPDNCPAICDDWAKKDRRIVVIHKENGGQSSARNVGLDIARGEYVGFVDADDFIDHDMYEILLHSLVSTNVDIVCCGSRIVNEKWMALRDRYKHEKKSYSGTSIIKALFYGIDFDEAMWDKLYRRSFFEDIRFPNGEVNEEIVLMVKKFVSLNTLNHIGTAKYNYRYNMQSTTKSKYGRKMSVTIKHLTEIKEFIIKEAPQLLPDYYFLQARYSKSQLIRIYLSNGAKQEFKNDFRIYRKLLVESMKYVMKSKLIPKRDKIQMILLKYHLWGLLYRIRHM